MISSLRPRPRSRVLLVVVLATLVASPVAHAQRAASPAATPPGASPLAVAPPESAGMSAARLARLTALFKKAGTLFWVDPKEQLVAVFMVQSAGALRVYHRNLFRQLVYQAIAD